MFKVTFDLTETEERRVEELLGALRSSVEVSLNPDSALMAGGFGEEFESRLLVQHVFLGSVLYQEAFDAAFSQAAAEGGFECESAPVGQRFWDLSLNGKQVSLKSTKAASLKEDKLHISKLTEAAWIQDCRSARTRRAKTFELFKEYIEEVASIYQLRFFRDKNKYELVEIPGSVFKEVLKVPATHFSADGPTINIPVGEKPPYFTLKLDRSDAKITIANILKARCVVHGVWKLG